MRGFEPDAIAVPGESFECEGAIENRNHNPSRSWIQAAVHHKKVAVMDACAAHGMATDAQEKGAGGVAN